MKNCYCNIGESGTMIICEVCVWKHLGEEELWEEVLGYYNNDYYYSKICYCTGKKKIWG